MQFPEQGILELSVRRVRKIYRSPGAGKVKVPPLLLIPPWYRGGTAIKVYPPVHRTSYICVGQYAKS